jgi:hypothetical protein
MKGVVFSSTIDHDIDPIKAIREAFRVLAWFLFDWNRKGIPRGGEF